ncbi:hypothetical protein [Sphingomonas phyllosphaerae]|uniref:hypothetical protein n=1 Tax=Sphingomonas phyllosphaerae TaxID=257003 RepID=UPI0003B5C940|nr:hypothetical protein [Sphingomonas phyllosphaerae]
MPGPLLLLLAQVATPATPAPAPASAPVAAAPPAPAPADVIVVGHRAEKDLAACVARHCPPVQEVEASLQASVEQFADGRYVDARQTLQAAIRRNKRYAATLPGPVSSLYATLATVAEHEGDTNLWRTASRNNVSVLRQQLGAMDVATMTEELSFADDMVGQGAIIMADNIYGKIQRRAAANGQPALAASAAFRRGWLALQRNRFREAERFADTAVTLAGGADSTMAELREILRTRVAIRKGDDTAVDALAARLRQSTEAHPVLLYAPPIEDINPPRGRIDALPPLRDDAIHFADVGYWIRPDGTVADAELLRSNGLGQWAPGILHHVGARRYVPLRASDGQPGRYRIDRFTVRGDMDVPIGTRIRQRMGKLSVHVIDLTETEAMSAMQRQRMAARSAIPTPAPAPAR